MMLLKRRIILFFQIGVSTLALKNKKFMAVYRGIIFSLSFF